MRPITWLLLFMILPVLGGCHFATDREEADLHQRDQLIANLQADVYEAAVATDKGVDVHLTTTAIRVSAITTIQVLGFTYPVGEAWVKTLQVAPGTVAPGTVAPGTGPLPPPPAPVPPAAPASPVTAPAPAPKP